MDEKAKAFAEFLKANHLYPVDSIRPDPTQPREYFPTKTLKELAVSIAHEGLDNDAHIREDVVGEWLLVNGERRWTAISLHMAGVLQEMAKNGTEPCMKGWFRDENGVMYLSCRVKEYRGEKKAIEQQVYMDQLRDNEVRENLGPMATLKAFKRAVDEFNIPLEDVATTLGKSVATLEGDLPILGLPKAITNAFEAGTCSKAVARRLAELPDDESLRLRAFTRAKRGSDVKDAIARIDAYAKKRRGEGGSLFGEYQEENPKWRKEARSAFGRLANAVNVFDSTPYSNGKMRQIVMAQLKDMERIELVAKAMKKQAANLLAEVIAVRAETGKTA